jgi:hypothetical protein
LANFAEAQFVAAGTISATANCIGCASDAADRPISKVPAKI